MIREKENFTLYRILTFPIVLSLWEILSRSGIYNPKLFPPPTKVLVTLWEDIVSGLLLGDVIASLSRVFVGFFIAALLGISLGVLTGRIKLAQATLGQIFLLVRPIPPISYVPFAVLWFGIGEFSKFFLVFIGVFFPIWMNAHLGIQNVPINYIWSAQSMGASSRSLIFNVYLPAATPLILAGLRVGIAIAFYCLVAAEIAGAFSGIAYRIEISHLLFRADRMLANLIALGLLSATADQLLAFLVRRFLPWATLTAN
jgi:ABC-type nitrate/sulfonate/bicarbonate transport system permease component